MTTVQLIFSLIMIWVSGIAIGAAIIARIAVRLMDKNENDGEI